MGHIGSELIRILFTLLDLAQHHTVDLRRRPDLQEAAHLLLRQEAGGTVGGVRENVEAAGVADKLVAGEKNVPLLVIRQTSSTSTAVTPSPKGVNRMNQFRKGLNTQMLSTSAPDVWKVAAVPSWTELRNIP